VSDKFVRQKIGLAAYLRWCKWG